MLKRSIIFLSLVSIVFLEAHSQQIYDATYQSWVEDFHKKEYESLYRQLSTEVEKDDPHPLALNAWRRLAEILNTSDGLMSSEGKRYLTRQYAEYDLWGSDYQSYGLLKDGQSKDVDLYSRLSWINGSSSMADPNDLYQMIQQELEKNGENFRTIWVLMNLAENIYSIRQQLESDLKEGKYDNYPGLRDFMRGVLVPGVVSDINGIAAALAFLEKYPDDAIAHRYLGSSFSKQQKFDLARYHYQRSAKLDPFYFYNKSLLDAAKMYGELQQYDSLEIVHQQYVDQNFQPTEKDLHALTLGRLYNDIGYRYKARKIYEKAVEEYPDNSELLYELAELEKSDGRVDISIQLHKKALDISPDRYEYVNKYARALQSGKYYTEILDLTDNYLNEPDPDISYVRSVVYAEYEEWDMFVELYQKTVDYFPYSDWVNDRLAYGYFKQDDHERMLQSAQKVLDIDPFYSWGHYRTYIYWKEKIADQEKLAARLYEHALQYQTAEYAWVYLFNVVKDDSKRIEMIRPVMEAHPGRLFCVETVLERLYSSKDYQRMQQLLTDIESSVQANGTQYDKVWYQYYLANSTRGKIRDFRISSDERETALQAIIKYKELYGETYRYHEILSDLYENAGEKDKLMHHAYELTRYRPDAQYAHFRLISYGHPQRFLRLYEWLMRNPLDEDRAQKYVQYSLYWGGSAINALRVMHEFDYDFASYRRTALQRLGSNEVLSWNNNTSISPSQRYIGWYDNDRKSFWRSQTSVNIDYETNTAQIFFADGTYAERQDDFESSKIKRLQVGDTFVKAEYDSKGNVTEISTSAGDFVRYQYDDNGKIERIENSQEGEMYFEYNDMGKPVLIRYEGVGEINVIYNQAGEIESVDSEGGSQISLKVTQAFQQMLSLTKVFEQASNIQQGRLPQLGFQDPEYERLSDEYLSVSYDRDAQWYKIALDFSKYLASHTTSSPDNGPEALMILEELFDYSRDKVSHKEYENALEVVDLFHQILLKIRKRGVALDYWNTWVDIQDWLQVEKLKQTKLNKYRKAIENLQDKFREQPIVLLSSTEWLPKAKINNRGYWTSQKIGDIVPSRFRNNIEIRDVLIRANGDRLLATNQGLAVNSKGFWVWMVYHPVRRAFTEDFSAVNTLTEESSIRSIAEDDQGNVWLGTDKGLLLIGGEYDDRVDQRLTVADGLSSSIIDFVMPLGARIYIGTPKGLMVWQADELLAVEGLEGQVIKDLSMGYEYLFALTNNGVYRIGDLKATSISTDIKDAIYALGDNLILATLGSEVTKIVGQDDASYLEIPVYDNLLTSATKNTFGFVELPIDSYDIAPGVLTDYGISFYKDDHFEEFSVPAAEIKSLHGGDYLFADQGSDILLFNDREVFIFEDADIRVEEGEISDIVTKEDLGLTFVADGSLKYVAHDDPEATVQTLDYYANTTSLAIDAEGNLIANDGLDILRYRFEEDGNYSVENLFYAYQFEPEKDYTSGPVYDMMVASDGSLWVTTQLSVFHYQEHDTSSVLTEYNFFKDPEKFPSRSHWHYAVHETPDGRILAIASDESHLYHKGLSLEGGILLFDPQSQKFIKEPFKDDPTFNPPSWFLTSITPLNESKSIVGTVAGFGELNNGVFQKYGEGLSDIKNASYQELKKDQPNLFLGTKGVQMGDIWLFGTGAGIVGCNNGIWFYPDRLNQMLPDDLEFGNYGSRHVNALDIDENGRMYIGTDRGLLTYETGGKNAVSFLMSEFDPGQAFVYQNSQTLSREARSFVESIDRNSEAGKLIASIEEDEKKMADLELKLAVASTGSRMDNPRIRVADSDSLDVVLRAVQQRHAEMLLQLQEREPAIYQALRVPPLDIMSQRSKFNEGEMIVQYIPLGKQLHIQVVAKDRLLLKKVDITREELMDTVRYVAGVLANNLNSRGTRAVEVDTRDDMLASTLKYLFDILVKPVYNDMLEAEVVYVIPNEALYYIPFSALIVDDQSDRYLVEDVNIGYLSSLYLYQLLIKSDEKKDGSVVLFGDPDGSLPGARKEVESIAGLLNAEYYNGGGATTRQFLASINNAKYVHLATHGYLDRESLKDSWLLFADRKYNMSEAYSLPLAETDMVVLSACETSYGGQGLEYATLARSFCNAGASTVLATLWQVNDEASEKLMIEFYKQLQDGKNKFEALAQAQRNLIRDGEFRHPSKWAAYIPIGRP